MKYLKVLVMAAVLLLLAACGEMAAPEVAQEEINVLSAVSGISPTTTLGSTTSPLQVNGNAGGAASTVDVTFTVTGNQEGTATFKVNQNWVLEGSTWNGSDPTLITVEPRSSDDPAETFPVTISIRTGTISQSGPKTLQVPAFDITNSNKNGAKLSAGTNATINVNFNAGPTHTHAKPTITIPASVTLEATGPAGAVHTFTVLAQDEGRNALTATCDWNSGDTFPLGTTTFPLGTTTTVICEVSDNHSPALTESGSFTVTVRDTAAPVIDGMPANIELLEATGPTGAVATWTAPTASDLVDGSVPVICKVGDNTVTPGSTFALGTTTVSCTATDLRGNTTTPAQTFNVTVSYAWSGVLQPINTTGTRSQFKLGSTIPVKFQLTGESSSVTNAVAKLTWKKLASSTSGETEAVATNSPDSGNTFRYSDGQYIFNLSTKALGSEGTYELSIDLGDGVSRKVEIAVRK